MTEASQPQRESQGKARRASLALAAREGGGRADEEKGGGGAAVASATAAADAGDG